MQEDDAEVAADNGKAGEGLDEDEDDVNDISKDKLIKVAGAKGKAKSKAKPRAKKSPS
jgi:hypothetical protein